ncbi:hypothetical protein [Rhizobium leguminosarum]|uniref:hypothetical protein n=1 Tax=Rhizobium leguminosarum TaxID=384 RepID=UPI001FE16070|nr:hypothetical protein [Rhizobium leguminosarum]
MRHTSGQFPERFLSLATGNGKFLPATGEQFALKQERCCDDKAHNQENYSHQNPISGPTDFLVFREGHANVDGPIRAGD